MDKKPPPGTPGVKVAVTFPEFATAAQHWQNVELISCRVAFRQDRFREHFNCLAGAPHTRDSSMRPAGKVTPFCETPGCRCEQQKNSALAA